MRLLTSKRGAIADQLEARLAQEAPDVTITWFDEQGIPLGPTDDAEIFFRTHMVSRTALEMALQSAPTLRWLHTASAGIDSFVAIFRQNAPPGMIITRGSGSMSRPIAEYVIGQIFAIAKQFPTYLHAQDRHEWIGRVAPPARDMHGSRILILGLGNIGRDLARLAQGVGMRVWATRRGASDGSDLDGLEAVFSQDDDWRGVLPTMEYVVSCLPLTNETREILGAPELAAMSPNAWIINISRGGIIDEPALIAALQEGRLGGAALDVTATEPLPADHPLWQMPNVIITPHISWRSPDDDTHTLDLFFDNLRRYRAGQPLRNVVSLEEGY